MYTGRAVRRFVRPVALIAIIGLGALPGTMVVCQWVCASATVATEDAAPHHHHAAAPARADDRGVAIGAAATACRHEGGGVIAVTAAASFTVFAPSAIHLSAADCGDIRTAAASTPAHAAHSPPGARSSPRPLRI